MASSANNSTIAKNTAFLYFRMILVLVVSLYTSRVTLNVLGVDDYGVYNVVAGFVTMFGFFNATLSSSLQRYYNYEGTLDKQNGFNKVYNTGFIIHFILGIIILLLLESLGLWYVNHVMVIPSDRLFTANIVYQTAVLSMLLVVFQIPYTGAIIAAEKMNYYAIISVFDVSLKLLCIILLPFFPFDKLIAFGLISLLISFFDFFAYYFYARKHILYKGFEWKTDKILLKSIMSFSGWNLIGTFAFLLKGQGLNMLLNYFFGPIINAARGIAYQVNGAISGFSSNISIAFRPQIVNSYADSDLKRTRFMMYSESKICFALMVLLMTPMAFEINYLLKIWLGDIVPENTNVFAILVLIDSLICTLNTPCTQVAFAVGNLKNYQMANSIVNLLLVPFSWLFLYLGYDALSVFLITIVFSILNQIVCLVFLNKLFPIHLKAYLFRVIVPCLLFLVAVPLLLYIPYLFFSESLLRLLIIAIVDFIAGGVMFYFIMLQKSEKEFCITFIRSKILKK